MLFTLEVLQAKHGDALLLHWGDPAAPCLAVIDGGPAGVYSSALRPRLDALRAARAPGGSLLVDLLMVSHLDDDHIRGVLDLVGDLVDATEAGERLPYAVTTLWHNSFDDLLGNRTDELAAAFAAAAPLLTDGVLPASLAGVREEGALVAASVGQGRKLRQLAARLAWNLNSPFPRLVQVRPPGAASGALDHFGHGLSLTVAGPTRERLAALAEEWDHKLRELAVAVDPAAVGAAFIDENVFNLSSIVVLAELGGKKMLLTGDARGDFTLEGLGAAGLLDADGRLELDVLKVPHHGSDHNVTQEYFERLPARHYVLSGDGRHGNPEVETLAMIAAANAGREDFTLWCTYPLEKIDTFVAAERARGRTYEVRFPAPGARSLRLELGSAMLTD